MINAIAPGFIATPMTDIALNSDPERKAKVFTRTPMGYMGQPADIADAAYFLRVIRRNILRVLCCR